MSLDERLRDALTRRRSSDESRAPRAVAPRLRGDVSRSRYAPGAVGLAVAIAIAALLFAPRSKPPPPRLERLPLDFLLDSATPDWQREVPAIGTTDFHTEATEGALP